jgi:hypothetical protein
MTASISQTGHPLNDYVQHGTLSKSLMQTTITLQRKTSHVFHLPCRHAGSSQA